MTTATATASAEPDEPRIRPLIQDGRICLEGEKNLPVAWCTLPTAEDIDRFYSTPGQYLDGAMNFVQPYQILHLIDDASTVFSICLVLMIRQAGAMADVIELLRKPLRPAISAAAADGWTFAHLGAAKGWSVLHNGRPKRTNLVDENMARQVLIQESQNYRNAGAVSLNPKSAEYKDDKIQR
jgi:hypothetical protein